MLPLSPQTNKRRQCHLMGTGGAVTALSQRRDSELELVTVDTLGRIIQVREGATRESPLQVATKMTSYFFSLLTCHLSR